MAVIVNIPNAHDDNSQWNASGGYWDINIRTDDGFVFQGDVKAVYTNTSGYPKSVVLDMNGAKVRVFGELSDTDVDTEITITGNTRSENDLEVINNIPNTTATGKKGAGYFDAIIQVTANEGYKITAAQVKFTNGYDYPETQDLTISPDGKTASWEYDNTNTKESFTLTGTTAREGTPEITVVNNITNTLKEEHTYDGDVATITVESKHWPKYRFIDPKASYKSTDGQQKTVDMQAEFLSYYSLAKVTINDLDPTEPVTLTGKFVEVVHITANLTNCYADPPLPDWLQFGETFNINIKANPNTEFHSDEEKPTLTWQDKNGNYQHMDLTVSKDKQTVTGTKVLDVGLSTFTVNADAYPVTVVGGQYGAINVYLVTLDELAEFSGKRFFKETGTDPETGMTIYENIDLGAYVNKIRRVYTNIGASSTDVIRCGNYNTGVSCNQPAQDKITLDFGTAVVPAHNEDNTDYESEIQIFLPFASFVTLNNDYAGKTIGLQYVINVVTGNGVALLSCDGVVFQVEETEPSSEIIYLSPSTQVKTVGGDDWNEMLYYGLEPYIYCKWYESASNGRNNDRQTGILGDFRGFNVFDDVTPIHTAEMLTEEQEMIYTVLSDGVYIE